MRGEKRSGWVGCYLFPLNQARHVIFVLLAHHLFFSLSLSRHNVLQTMQNLGVIRFMGRNVFCFLESGWLYVSVAEMKERSLLPEDYGTVMTEPLLGRLYSSGDVSWITHFVFCVWLCCCWSRTLYSASDFVVVDHALCILCVVLLLLLGVDSFMYTCMPVLLTRLCVVMLIMVKTVTNVPF